MAEEIKKDNKYASETIENEGLDYAVRHYISGSAFADPITARLWENAEKACNELVDHLQSYGSLEEGF